MDELYIKVSDNKQFFTELSKLGTFTVSMVHMDVPSCRLHVIGTVENRPNHEIIISTSDAILIGSILDALKSGARHFAAAPNEEE